MTTVVVGGGLAGSFAARALSRRGTEVVVVDAGEEPGGVTVPVRHQGYLLEPAAGTLLLPHPHLTPLLEGLDVTVVSAGVAATRRFLRVGGRSLDLVLGPGLLVAPVLSWPGKLRVVAEPLVGRANDPEESLSLFLQRRLGREAGRLVAGLMAAGVHGGDPERLSASAAFPALVALEQAHGSFFRSFLVRRGQGTRPSTHVVEGGIAAVARAVAVSLGSAWLAQWRVEKIERVGERWRLHGPEVLEADELVAAVPPETLLELLREPGGEEWDWAPVAVVWLGLVEPELPEALGCLVGPDEGLASLGFLYESAYAPGRAPAGRGLVKVLLGGARRPDVIDWGDAELVATATAELATVLGAIPRVEMSYVMRHRPGIPQYTARRRRQLERLRRALPPGISVVGWGYDGVGVSALATRASSLMWPG